MCCPHVYEYTSYHTCRVLWDRITLSDSEDEAPFTAQSQGVQPMEGGGDQESKDERGISEDKERKW